MQSDDLQSISPRYRGRPTTVHCDIDQKRVYRKIDGKKQPTCVEQTEVRKKCPTGKINYKDKCIKKGDKPKGTRGRPRTLPACDKGKKRVYRKVDGVKTRTCVKPTEVRKKCPTGKINHKDKCIKKGDKPKGTRGRPKKQPLLTKDTIQKKTQLVAKEAQAAAQKKRRKKHNKKRLKLNAKEYNKVVKEIEEFYRGKFDLESKIYYSLHNYDKFLINDDDIKNMPAFMKFSGITKEEAEKIIEKSRKLYKKLEFDACNANAFILDNILLGKINVNVHSFNENEELPIEVLLGTAIHDNYNNGFSAWEWTEVGPFNYWGMEVYEKIKNPKFLEEDDLYAIKSFNKKRYNKFLDLMKKKGVEF